MPCLQAAQPDLSLSDTRIPNPVRPGYSSLGSPPDTPTKRQKTDLGAVAHLFPRTVVQRDFSPR